MSGFTVRKKVLKPPSISAREDAWQVHATDVAIEAARKIIHSKPGDIPPGTPVGSLNNVEWGWLVAAALFGWISTRAEQATLEGLETEHVIRMLATDPQPWDVGMVLAILPELAKESPDVDWGKPLGKWEKDELAEFLLTATRLIQKAQLARDTNSEGVTRQTSAGMIETQSLRGRISF